MITFFDVFLAIGLVSYLTGVMLAIGLLTVFKNNSNLPSGMFTNWMLILTVLQSWSAVGYFMGGQLLSIKDKIPLE